MISHDTEGRATADSFFYGVWQPINAISFCPWWCHCRPLQNILSNRIFMPLDVVFFKSTLTTQRRQHWGIWNPWGSPWQMTVSLQLYNENNVIEDPLVQGKEIGKAIRKLWVGYTQHFLWWKLERKTVLEIMGPAGTKAIMNMDCHEEWMRMGRILAESIPVFL